MVADALSRKLIQVSSLMIKEMELLESFRDLSLNVSLSLGKLKFRMVTVASGLLEEIKAKKLTDEELIEKRTLVVHGKAPEFTVGNDNIV